MATRPGESRSAASRPMALAAGGLTGLLGLIAMVRLVVDAFGDTISVLAWAFLLLAMVPWVGYAAWRGWHGRLPRRAAAIVLALCGGGLLAVWWFTLGAVLALSASLAAFVVVWVHDWPVPATRGDPWFVPIDELGRESDRALEDPGPSLTVEAA